VARSRPARSRRRITLSGYEGSELLVARLLVESGADLRYVGTACPRTEVVGRRPRMARAASGVHVQYRASLEQDLAALAEFRPDLAIGTTPVVQKAKETARPGALLHQPDFGAPADGSGRRGLAGAGRQRRASPARRASTR
jgi:chlorophyllide a reductase subunit Y